MRPPPPGCVPEGTEVRLAKHDLSLSGLQVQPDKLGPRGSRCNGEKGNSDRVASTQARFKRVSVCAGIWTRGAAQHWLLKVQSCSSPQPPPYAQAPSLSAELASVTASASLRRARSRGSGASPCVAPAGRLDRMAPGL